MVCMNTSFLLLGSLKIKRILAVGEWQGHAPGVDKYPGTYINQAA